MLSFSSSLLACGSDAGKVGGVCLLEWSRHQPQMQMTSGNGFELRCFLLDCCLCTSVIMSSTGRSAGHEGGADCASIPALRRTTVTAHRTYTPRLYRAAGPAFPLFFDSAQASGKLLLESSCPSALFQATLHLPFLSSCWMPPSTRCLVRNTSPAGKNDTCYLRAPWSALFARAASCLSCCLASL